MLRLPGREEKRVTGRGFLSSYKDLFQTLKETSQVQREIKRDVFFELKQKYNSAGAIRLHDVEKYFGRHHVLHNVSLTISPGKIFGIVGASGSGKTTLLRLISGFYKPTKGTILYDQKNIQQQKKVIEKLFGFATQDNSFYSHLTAEENMKYFGRLYGLKEDRLLNHIDMVLQLVDLDYVRKTLAEKLSGGMKRRLDLACAMIHHPRVLILDEPTEDLDPILRHQLLHLIKRINQTGATVIFTTHLLEEVEFLCDEIAFLHDGKIVAIGTLDDLRRKYKAGEEIHLVLEETKNYPKYIRSLGKARASVEENKLIVSLPKREDAVKVLKRILSLILKQKDKIVFADIRKPSLTEVFDVLIKNAKKSKK